MVDWSSLAWVRAIWGTMCNRLSDQQDLEGHALKGVQGFGAGSGLHADEGTLPGAENVARRGLGIQMVGEFAPLPGLLQRSGDEADQPFQRFVEFLPEGRVDIAQFLDQVADEALLLEISSKPEEG